jgi:hypothetical protein
MEKRQTSRRLVPDVKHGKEQELQRCRTLALGDEQQRSVAVASATKAFAFAHPCKRGEKVGEWAVLGCGDWTWPARGDQCASLVQH